MKCFHFPAGGGGEGGTRASRLSWARSRSMLQRRRSPLGLSPDQSPLLRPGAGPPDGLRAFAFAELRAATRGFSRALLIGEGGFGCVYRGVVNAPGEDAGAGAAMDVAVKQLDRNGLQGHKEWITEVNILGVAKHPNLVKLVGYCAEDDERGIQRLLVYEFMPNKSLEDHLLARVPSRLSWALRLKISRDAARGLAYLHEEMGFQVVGTVGYAAPEYVQTGRLTAKSDVWSFGVVLYELITGRRSIERNLPRSEQKLLEWVKPYATYPKRLHIIVDPRLEGQYCMDSVCKLVRLANKCLMKQPKSRPRMSQVVEMLDQIIATNGERAEAISIAPLIVEDPVNTTEILEERGSSMSWVVDFMEMISLRSRSVGKLERLLAPGPVGKFSRTWGWI